MISADYGHDTGVTVVWGEDGSGARPESVLRIALSRITYLQEEVLACDENEEIIECLRQALHWEAVRRQRRMDQGLDGTTIAHRSEDWTASSRETTLQAHLVNDEVPAHGSAVTLSDDEPPPPPADPNPTPPPVHEHEEPPTELSADEHERPLSICMPCEDGRYIPAPVLDSIAMQGIPYRLFISTAISDGRFADARNHVKDMALLDSSPFLLMTDNDLVFGERDFQAMLQFLDANPDYGAVAISKHGDPDPSGQTAVVDPTHVDAGPVMFRRDTLTREYQWTDPEHPDSEPETRKFEYDNAGGVCECQAACNKLRDEMGLRIGFLTGRAVKHIQNTKLSNA